MHGTFPSFLASWAAMTATMLLMAVPAAARYAHGRIATGRVAAGSAAEMVFQCVQSGVPVAGQRGQELLCHLHRRGAQPLAHPASLARFGGHDADLGQ